MFLDGYDEDSARKPRDPEKDAGLAAEAAESAPPPPRPTSLARPTLPALRRAEDAKASLRRWIIGCVAAGVTLVVAVIVVLAYKPSDAQTVTFPAAAGAQDVTPAQRPPVGPPVAAAAVVAVPVAAPAANAAAHEPAIDDDADEPDDSRAAPIPSPEGGLTRADVLSGLGPVRALMERCVEQEPGQGTVKMTLSSAGRVVAASVAGAYAGTRTGDCIAAAARTGVFRGTRREQTTLVYPFALRRVQ